MFVKLFKYDFKATWGLLGGLSMIALGAGALGSVVVRLLDTDVDGFLLTMLIISLIAVIFYLVGYSLAAMFILLGRFYKSRFTDEGYMTFTLPVNTHQVLLSSFLNCALGMLLSVLVTILAFGIMVFFGAVDLDGRRLEFVKLCFDYLPRFLKEVGAGNALVFLLMLLAGFLGEVLTIMLAITIGSIVAKKHKILVGIVVYYGLHIAMTIATVAFANSLGDTWVSNTFQGFAWGSIAWSVALSLGCYFTMYYLTSRKLNLN